MSNISSPVIMFDDNAVFSILASLLLLKKSLLHCFTVFRSQSCLLFTYDDFIIIIINFTIWAPKAYTIDTACIRCLPIAKEALKN